MTKPTGPTSPQATARPSRRRRAGIGVLVAGVALTSASVTGALAAFTDVATHGSNSFRSAELARPIDIRVNRAAAAAPNYCAGSTENVTVAATSFDGSNLTGGAFGDPTALTNWHTFCVENVGRLPALVTLRVVDVIDTETGCTGAEPDVDTTCGGSEIGAQPGELLGAVRLEIRLVDKSSGCGPSAPAASIHRTFAELGPDGGLVFNLGLPTSSTNLKCVSYRLHLETTDEVEIQRAQSDRLTWRFQLTAADTPGIVPPTTTPDA